jgi:ribosomal protein S18 acetylase RimI-like enzyme
MHLIREIEELSLNAWTAPQSAVYDGWILNYASGYTRRANSVQVLYPSTKPLAEKIPYCEAFYTARSQPTHFKLTRAAQPPELDSTLAALGYKRGANTSVQSLALEDVTWDIDIEGQAADVRSYPSPVWLESYNEMFQLNPIYYNVSRTMHADHVLHPTHFVLLWDRSKPVATAMMVIERGFAGVYDVVVRESHRGRGYGRRLMDYLIWLARTDDAHTMYLNVMIDNTIAWNLYQSIGFRELYTYWYREKPLPLHRALQRPR